MTAVESIKANLAFLSQKRILVLFFMGFSSGLPFLLVSGTLKLWLRKMGFEMSTIGIFAMVMTPYTFKFIWSPMIDHLHLPWLSKRLGHRRSWAILTQALLVVSIFSLGFVTNSQMLFISGLVAFVAAFCSSTQDIVLDAYRVEILEKEEYAAGAGIFVTGYRIALVVAGAGVLYLVDRIGWVTAYSLMGALFVIGMIAVLIADEPDVSKKRRAIDANHTGPKPTFAEIVQKTVIEPFSDFLTRHGWALILAFIVFFKIADNMFSTLLNPFYSDLEFTNDEIASVTKVFGLIATIVGLGIGGFLMKKYGLFKTLLIGGITQMASTSVFAVLANVGHSVPLLAFTVGFENVASGVGTAAFLAFLAMLCNVKFTATQYALFSSFFQISGSWLAAPIGYLQEGVGWFIFFLIMTALAIPGLILLFQIRKRTYLKEEVLT